MLTRNAGRILVIGGTGFIGYLVINALLEAGAEVTALVRPNDEKALPPDDRINITYADVWNRASLKGRARNHSAVIHLVGSTHDDPTRGLTHHQINLVSARNVTGMAVSDGVPYMILLSAVVRPGDLPGEYIRSKREAEDYLANSGLDWTVVRAPALFPSITRNPTIRLLSFLGTLFPLSLLLGRLMPLSADIAAWGIAGIALNPTLFQNRVVYANHLRRVAKLSGRNPEPLMQISRRKLQDDDPEGLDEPPFGWLPPH